MGGSFPEFYTREAAMFDPSFHAPKLVLTLGGGTPGDVNCDGLVNLIDYDALADCLAGPAAAYGDPICATFDFDEDLDVDLNDVAAFVRLVHP
jgi:hypothetical protein